ncbi:MAG: DUF2247 family protein [Desulfobacteraceae bacterium]|nr:DUF2247 family protein [Desulfobacteraceae bacterium]
MSSVKMLKGLGLLCWSTIYVGFKKGWLKPKDVIDYAVSLLMADNDDEAVVLIAGGEFLNDEELLNLVSHQVQNIDEAAALEKWRLADLLCVAESESNDQEKLDNLQEVYAKFEYPEDMKSCSIYSQNGMDPLLAMVQVVKELKRKYLLE